MKLLAIGGPFAGERIDVPDRPVGTVWEFTHQSRYELENIEGVGPTLRYLGRFPPDYAALRPVVKLPTARSKTTTTVDPDGKVVKKPKPSDQK